MINKEIKIGNVTVSQDSSPIFVAELGICHEGSLDVALELTEKAFRAGADIIKTETFQRKEIVFDDDAIVQHMQNGKEVIESMAEHMDKYELSFEQHHEIKKLADKLGIPFISTAHNFESVDFLVNIGAAGIKIASPDIIHYPLLRYVAKTSLPIFLDTGGAYQYEIEMAVKVLNQGGKQDIIINHNPSGHPALEKNHNLNTIKRLLSIFPYPIGLADHYAGYDMLKAAIIAGATVIEKPISRDRFVNEPERSWSITIDDLQDVINSMQNFYQALGQSEKEFTEEAEKYRERNRMCCIAADNLKQGTVITLDNIKFGRPRKGIGVEFWDQIEGLKLRRDKQKHDFIKWTDLDEC